MCEPSLPPCNCLAVVAAIAGWTERREGADDRRLGPFPVVSVSLPPRWTQWTLARRLARSLVAHSLSASHRPLDYPPRQSARSRSVAFNPPRSPSMTGWWLR